MIDKLKENKVLFIIIGILSIILISSFIKPKEDVIQQDFISTTPPIEDNTYIVVDIKGEVKNPGIYKLDENTRLYQLIFKAGGLTKNADIYAFNQSIILKDETIIYIPSFEDDFPKLWEVNNEQPNDGKININTATLNELESLTGIGPSTAQDIIDYRENNGDFETVEDLKNVPGIGDVTYDKIKDNITTK